MVAVEVELIGLVVGVVLRLDDDWCGSSPDEDDTLILVPPATADGDNGGWCGSLLDIISRDWFFGGGVGRRVPTDDDDGEGDEQLL